MKHNTRPDLPVFDSQCVLLRLVITPANTCLLKDFWQRYINKRRPSRRSAWSICSLGEDQESPVPRGQKSQGWGDQAAV